MRTAIAFLLILAALSMAGCGLRGCGKKSPSPSAAPPASTTSKSPEKAYAADPSATQVMKPPVVDDPAPPETVEALRPILAGILSAWEKKDVEAVLRMCTDSFSGAQGETRTELALIWPEMMKTVTLTAEDVHFSMSGSEVAVYPVRFDLGTTRGDLVFLFRKEADAWKWSAIRVGPPETKK
ncbi:MAG TPA: hypothetical protein P5318_02535 [Candidatus Hydrogenedentes bacterium]|nr:hypothetical protein [Candidatus Hydrogenedentota bacterium]HPC16524.1 hypothetical protein [Candidatus Hydrogenedentota bacterium]HRT18977.1 hypothetical protein [Candidatus Hydrogenedentota bacterium]HRT65667.1 hypothetical protein [Candidatus Hydrogenedentota bacterium]